MKKAGSKIYHLEQKKEAKKNKHRYYTSIPQLMRYNEEQVGVSLRTLRSHDFSKGPYEGAAYLIHKGELIDKTMVPRKKRLPKQST